MAMLNNQMVATFRISATGRSIDGGSSNSKNMAEKNRNGFTDSLWKTNSSLSKMAIEIVDLPIIIKVVIFHSCVNVYQRVY
jgi:hypothetical protein